MEGGQIMGNQIMGEKKYLLINFFMSEQNLGEKQDKQQFLCLKLDACILCINE